MQVEKKIEDKLLENLSEKANRGLTEKKVKVTEIS